MARGIDTAGHMGRQVGRYRYEIDGIPIDPNDPAWSPNLALQDRLQVSTLAMKGTQGWSGPREWTGRSKEDI